MRLLIADDHPLFRDGLRSLLEARGRDVVGEARDGREAIEQARRSRPDVLLMDLHMPARGDPALTPGLAKRLLGEFARPAPAPRAPDDEHGIVEGSR